MPSRLLPAYPDRRILPVQSRTLTRYERNTAAVTGTTTVTAGGSSHTKNTTYTELIASTSFDTYRIEIDFSDVNTNATDTGVLVDIATGAAASEVVIIPNLNAGHAGALSTAGTGGGQKYAFPLFIPAGSRVSATAQAVVAGDTVGVVVRLFGGPREPAWVGTQVVDYGTALGTSQGVSVTMGAGSEGAWTQIVATTTQDHGVLSAGVALNATSGTNNRVHLDIATGAAASEVAISEDWEYGIGSASALSQWRPVEIWVPVPSGTRLAARIQSNANTTAKDVILYGVT